MWILIILMAIIVIINNYCLRNHVEDFNKRITDAETWIQIHEQQYLGNEKSVSSRLLMYRNDLDDLTGYFQAHKKMIWKNIRRLDYKNKKTLLKKIIKRKPGLRKKKK